MDRRTGWGSPRWALVTTRPLPSTATSESMGVHHSLTTAALTEGNLRNSALQLTARSRSLGRRSRLGDTPSVASGLLASSRAFFFAAGSVEDLEKLAVDSFFVEPFGVEVFAHPIPQPLAVFIIGTRERF